MSAEVGRLVAWQESKNTEHRGQDDLSVVIDTVVMSLHTIPPPQMEPSKVLALARGLAVMAAGFLLAACGEGRAPATLIVDALVVDGSGESARVMDVRIRGGLIADLGELSPQESETVVDASGLVLAPGFIDTHSHHDRGLPDERDAVSLLSQGVTTIVVGQDGSSRVPMAEFFQELDERPPAVNVASFVGHNTIRRMVMQDDF